MSIPHTVRFLVWARKPQASMVNVRNDGAVNSGENAASSVISDAGTGTAPSGSIGGNPFHQGASGHVTRGWPHLGEPLVRPRGQYCYVAALLPGHREPTPILRLRYQGSADHWTIGIYKPSTGQYSESDLPGSFGPATGTPEQGIDDTFILYAEPATGN